MINTTLAESLRELSKAQESRENKNLIHNAAQTLDAQAMLLDMVNNTARNLGFDGKTGDYEGAFFFLQNLGRDGRRLNEIKEASARHDKLLEAAHNLERAIMEVRNAG